MKILEKLKRIPRRLTCLIVGHDFIVETEETDDSWWEKEIDKIFEAYKDNPKLLRQYLALFFNSVNLSPTLAWRRSKTIWRCKRCGYEEVYYSYDKNSFDVIAYINKKLIEYGYEPIIPWLEPVKTPLEDTNKIVNETNKSFNNIHGNMHFTKDNIHDLYKLSQEMFEDLKPKIESSRKEVEDIQETLDVIYKPLRKRFNYKIESKVIGESEKEIEKK